MREKHSFREPLGKDSNGLYITTAQMRFFLNRRNGDRMFITGDSQFFRYFYKCAVYNIIWDLTSKDSTCATFYWDDSSESVAVKFPEKGIVMEELKNRKIEYYFSKEND